MGKGITAPSLSPPSSPTPPLPSSPPSSSSPLVLSSAAHTALILHTVGIALACRSDLKTFLLHCSALCLPHRSITGRRSIPTPAASPSSAAPLCSLCPHPEPTTELTHGDDSAGSSELLPISAATSPAPAHPSTKPPQRHLHCPGCLRGVTAQPCPPTTAGRSWRWLLVPPPLRAPVGAA